MCRGEGAATRTSTRGGGGATRTRTAGPAWTRTTWACAAPVNKSRQSELVSSRIKPSRVKFYHVDNRNDPSEPKTLMPCNCAIRHDPVAGIAIALCHRVLRICLLAALVGCGTETAAVVDAAGGSDAGQDAPALGDGGLPSPDLGGNLHPGGATFRIWAPHAQRAWVVGDFTPSDAGIEMESEDGGTFAVDVEG